MLRDKELLTSDLSTQWLYAKSSGDLTTPKLTEEYTSTKDVGL